MPPKWVISSARCRMARLGYRYLETVRAVSLLVPSEALMGYHLCYGDLAGHHIVQPSDLALLTRMASAAVAESGRRVDWLHMPVPADRADDAYFAPLDELNAPDSRLFLGLVHQGRRP